MKRRYKLLIIILAGTIATIIINSSSTTKKTTLVALGDSLSLGMTPYNVAGTSFNDYLKEDIERHGKLYEFNNEFSIDALTIHELNEYIEDNKISKFRRTPIKQIIAKADIITIAVGIDEFANKSLKSNINSEDIDLYINEIETFLKNVRTFYEKDIIIVGLYPAYNFNKKDAIEVNSILQKICGKYNTKFLDILAISLNENNYLEKNSYCLNYIAHKKISQLIYKMV